MFFWGGNLDQLSFLGGGATHLALSDPFCFVGLFILGGYFLRFFLLVFVLSILYSASLSFSLACLSQGRRTCAQRFPSHWHTQQERQYVGNRQCHRQMDLYAVWPHAGRHQGCLPQRNAKLFGVSHDRTGGRHRSVMCTDTVVFRPIVRRAGVCRRAVALKATLNLSESSKVSLPVPNQ